MQKAPLLSESVIPIDNFGFRQRFTIDWSAVCHHTRVPSIPAMMKTSLPEERAVRPKGPADTMKRISRLSFFQISKHILLDLLTYCVYFSTKEENVENAR